MEENPWRRGLKVLPRTLYLCYDVIMMGLKSLVSVMSVSAMGEEGDGDACLFFKVLFILTLYVQHMGVFS